MSVVNRFASFEGHQPQAGGGKKKKTAKPAKPVAAVASADTTMDPTERQLDPNYVPRGFKVVEAKANTRPKDKPRAARQDDAGNDANTFAFLGSRAAAAPAPKPMSKKRTGPPGSTVIHPEVEKRERKAVQALQRHLAKQTYAPKQGEAVGVVDVAPAATTTADAPATVTKGAARVAAELPGQPDVAEALGPQKKTRTHCDPQAIEPKAVPMKPAKAKAVGVTIIKNHPAAASGEKGGKKKATAKATADAAGFSNDKLIVVAAPVPAKGSGIDHTHLEDGSVLANVTYAVEFPSEKVPYKVTEECDKQTTRTLLTAAALLTPAGKEKLAAQIADRIQRGAPLRGGFYVGAESKMWSNYSTIDEPWMSESYLKGLLPLLTKEKTSSVCHPFWPTQVGPQKAGADVAEAEVALKLHGGSALELEHADRHCAARVNAHTLRVSFKPFVDAVIAQFGTLNEVLALVEAAVPADLPNREIAMSRLPRHLDALLPAVKDAAASYFATLP